MAIEREKLLGLIQGSFVGADVELIDLAGDNDHYQVIIKAQEFAGKTKVAQHRMVNEALKGCLGEELHALSIKTIAK